MAQDRSAIRALVAPSRPAAPPTPTYQRKTGIRRWLAQHSLDVLLVTPLVLYILFFMLVPPGQSIYLSLVSATGGELTFDNYRTVVNRSQFQAAFVNTLGITAMGVTMEMVVGIIIALMLSREFGGRGIFRSIVLVPLGVPTLVAGAAMLYFVGFNGYLNEILLNRGKIAILVAWWQSGTSGMFARAIQGPKKTRPWVAMVIFRSGWGAGDRHSPAVCSSPRGQRSGDSFWRHPVHSRHRYVRHVARTPSRTSVAEN